MTVLAEAQHFVRPPEWTWYIVPYFFLAGLAGGCYAIATLLRLWGERQDEDAARLGYYVAFPVFLLCPILLTLDLGQPQRFWHMLVNTTPGGEGLNFKWWSPMSLGSWALVVFGLFATVSFLEVLVRDRVVRLGLTDWIVRLLELALIVLFALTLIPDGTLGDAFGFPWILLWLVAFAGLVPGLRGLVTDRLAVTSEGDRKSTRLNS